MPAFNSEFGSCHWKYPLALYIMLNVSLVLDRREGLEHVRFLLPGQFVLSYFLIAVWYYCYLYAFWVGRTNFPNCSGEQFSGKQNVMTIIETGTEGAISPIRNTCSSDNCHFRKTFTHFLLHLLDRKWEQISPMGAQTATIKEAGRVCKHWKKIFYLLLFGLIFQSDKK